MTELRHIEDAIDRLDKSVEELSETFAYHAGLAIKVKVLEAGWLTDAQRKKLRELVIAEVIE